VEELLLLTAGFVLTTVLGGWLGVRFQQRAWDHQNEARLQEAELQKADDVCQSVSRLLDKRLYRMLRLFYVVRQPIEDEQRRAGAERRLADYDEVLFEWNDNLNLNLALMGSYFGAGARDWLEHRLYREFQQVGALIEEVYRHAIAGSDVAVDTAEIEAELLRLNDAVYRLGVFMMTHLREGRVGRHASQPLPRVETPDSVTSSGVPLASVAVRAGHS
jgi:hypothetical protein